MALRLVGVPGRPTPAPHKGLCLLRLAPSSSQIHSVCLKFGLRAPKLP